MDSVLLYGIAPDRAHVHGCKRYPTNSGNAPCAAVAGGSFPGMTMMLPDLKRRPTSSPNPGKPTTAPTRPDKNPPMPPNDPQNPPKRP
ncbi:hypothetical protein ACFWAR_00035 [Streptomyces sp. NPDC059917]|uniref:hypothetical protein n=1 Tax=Streptomyces sp. NPDC059917 TaxID=3347002 RepID=UPI003666A1B3